MTGFARTVRVLTGLAGMVVATGGAVATVLAPGWGAERVSAGSTDPAVSWLLLAGAVSLVIAGGIAWVARPGSGLSLIAFWAAAAWLAPELASSESVTREARSLGRVLAPMAIALLTHLPVRALRGDRGLPGIGLGALYLAMGATAIGHALTWDAYLVIDCLPVCVRGDNVLGLFADIRLSRDFRSAGWWLAAIAGVGLVLWAGGRLRHRRTERSTERLVLWPALATGATLVGWAAARTLPSDPSPVYPWSVRTAIILAVSVIALGAGVSLHRLREGRRVAGVRRLVELLDAGAGSRSLETTLATVLRDPTVHVAYPIEGGHGFVDDQGRLVVAPSVDARRRRAVTPIERGGVLVALVEHDADLDPELLSREVGAASRLAVDNERRAALLRAQVHELQASRERIVAAGDAARGRLERDLHDGAQQRLLAVSYELRLAQAAAQHEPMDRRAAIDLAVVEIDGALADLRDLAHGIWPAVLAEAGLEAALRSLADDATIPVELVAIPDERFPAPTEAAAYLAAAEAVQTAVSGGATGLVVRADRTAEELRLEARISGMEAPGPWLRVDDRVGAAGGRSSVVSDPVAGTLLTVELPCA
jgi:signal transduction histidine kinase